MRRTDRIFRVLSDPTRRALLERLARGEAAVKDLAARLDVSQPAVSQHLGELRRAGLVAPRRAGRVTYYRAEPGGLAPLLDWVDRYHLFWTERVRKLKALLEEMD